MEKYDIFTSGSNALTVASDLYNTKYKADALISILQNNRHMFNDHNILALYGDWGSGKTSVVKTVEKYFESGIYKTVYFEAWKYENGSDLALSLLDCIDLTFKSVTGKSSIINRIKKLISENIILSGEISVQHPTIPIAGKVGFQKKTNTSQSSYKLIGELNNEFDSLIKFIIKEYRVKGEEIESILIIIDDLDRCNPENILNVLSSIKHMLYSSDLVYLCAIDKESIDKAIKLKYGNIINCEDYLHKIFNFSVQMPFYTECSQSIRQFIELIKPNSRDTDDFGLYIKEINSYFMCSGINNPRKINVLFRHFLILQNLLTSNNNPSAFKSGSKLTDIMNPVSMTICLHFLYLYFNEIDIFYSLYNPEMEYPNLEQTKIEIEIGGNNKVLSNIMPAEFISPTNVKIDDLYEVRNGKYTEIRDNFIFWLGIPLISNELKNIEKIVFGDYAYLYSVMNSHPFYNFKKSQVHSGFLKYLFKTIYHRDYGHESINCKYMIDTIHLFL